jgi:hypothetical protein
MSNRRRLRQINRSSGQMQRQKHVWGGMASARNFGFTKREISRFQQFRATTKE